MVEFFLSQKADPTVKGRGGLPCLQVAQQFKNVAIIRMIQDALQGTFASQTRPKLAENNNPNAITSVADDKITNHNDIAYDQPIHSHTFPHVEQVPEFDSSLLHNSQTGDEEPTLPISSSEEDFYDENDLGQVEIPSYENGALDSPNMKDSIDQSEVERFTSETMKLTQKDYKELFAMLQESQAKDPEEEYNLELSSDEE